MINENLHSIIGKEGAFGKERFIIIVDYQKDPPPMTLRVYDTETKKYTNAKIQYLLSDIMEVRTDKIKEGKEELKKQLQEEGLL